jgi:predicted PurR-regulated permease PerM
VRQVLEPKVVGDQIGLPPLATLFSLYVGLKLLGPSGLILGPVTVILLMACQRAGVFARLAQYYRRV